uniref:hypothetical protein n=1 Tax=Celeribacter halophilus TaxID=576117 RepID=UPI003A9559CF
KRHQAIKPGSGRRMKNPWTPDLTIALIGNPATCNRMCLEYSQFFGCQIACQLNIFCVIAFHRTTEELRDVVFDCAPMRQCGDRVVYKNIYAGYPEMVFTPWEFYQSVFAACDYCFWRSVFINQDIDIPLWLIAFWDGTHQIIGCAFKRIGFERPVVRPWVSKQHCNCSDTRHIDPIPREKNHSIFAAELVLLAGLPSRKRRERVNCDAKKL